MYWFAQKQKTLSYAVGELTEVAAIILNNEVMRVENSSVAQVIIGLKNLITPAVRTTKSKSYSYGSL